MIIFILFYLINVFNCIILIIRLITFIQSFKAYKEMSDKKSFHDLISSGEYIWSASAWSNNQPFSF